MSRLTPLTAALLALALGAAGAWAAEPKPAKKAAKPKPETAVSTAAAGVEFPSYPPPAGEITLSQVAERFKETDSRIQSLKASFKQFVRMEGSDTTQSVEGDVLFRRPDLLRVTHRLPETQQIVSDGEWLWAYRPGTNQVIKTRLETWRKTEPLAQGLLDFGRSADLLERYDARIATTTPAGADGHRVIELVLKPKNAKAEFELTLKVSTKDFFPGDATLRVERASIHSIFSDVRLNPEIPDERFRFTPPKDADVFQSQESKK